MVTSLVIGPASADARSQIAFAKDGLFVADHTGRDARRIVDAQGIYGQVYNPSWSPDGTEVAYMFRDDIWVVRSDGSERRRVTTGADKNSPQWSHDGSRIYFTRLAGGANTYVGWVTPDGNAGGEFLGSNADNSPVPSPVGNLVAIGTATGERSRGIDLTDRDGDARRPFLRGGPEISYSAIDWSPDGSQLLLLANSNQFRAVIVNADGTGERTIRTGVIPLAWSPDGRRILFQDESYTLMTMAPDGTGVASLGISAGGGGDWSNGSVDPPAPASSPAAEASPSPSPASTTTSAAAPAAESSGHQAPAAQHGTPQPPQGQRLASVPPVHSVPSRSDASATAEEATPPDQVITDAPVEREPGDAGPAVTAEREEAAPAGDGAGGQDDSDLTAAATAAGVAVAAAVVATVAAIRRRRNVVPER